MDIFDLAVIGGGIAGTSAAVAAASCGLRVKWIHKVVEPDDQSLHWHGYLHRGHLYDSQAEYQLISALRESWHYWSQPCLAGFLLETAPLLIGLSETILSSRYDTLQAALPSIPLFATLRSNVAALVSDERILDGPRYLAAMWRAAESLTDSVTGKCMEVSAGSVSAPPRITLTVNDNCTHVHAKAVVIAAGVHSKQLTPNVPIENRISRMLVLRGELPKASFIAPGVEWGGLFMVSRSHYNESDKADAWLVSDHFSSATNSVSELLDGWWACSIAERISKLIKRQALADTTVTAYSAAKSRLSRADRTVTADSYAIDEGNRVAVLCPSKWTLAPTAAIALIRDLSPGTAQEPETQMLRLGAHVCAYDREVVSRPLERWSIDSPSLPFADLQVKSVETLRKAASLVRSSTFLPQGHVTKLNAPHQLSFPTYAERIAEEERRKHHGRVESGTVDPRPSEVKNATVSV
jgi:FAD dependent oxidoreductase